MTQGILLAIDTKDFTLQTPIGPKKKVKFKKLNCFQDGKSFHGHHVNSMHFLIRFKQVCKQNQHVCKLLSVIKLKNLINALQSKNIEHPFLNGFYQDIAFNLSLNHVENASSFHFRNLIAFNQAQKSSNYWTLLIYLLEIHFQEVDD